MTAWSNLTGWNSSDPRLALSAFQRSCEKNLKKAPDEPYGGASLPDGTAIYGKIGDWRDVCQAAAVIGDAPLASAKIFFETWFQPVKFILAPTQKSMFTGYYEPELIGALEPDNGFETPLLTRPNDLVMVDLGEFRDTLKGQRIAGRVQSGRLRPYEDRAQIEAGALDGKAVPIAYVSDPVDAFFLHIQGSGRVKLKNGDVLRVGYAGQNGHPYTSIGRVLINEGHLERGAVTMQSIRAWLATNDDQRDKILHQNASYIFFRDLEIEDPLLGPIGAQGVPLTPRRSLAVDRKFHGLGAPIWVETNYPDTDEPLRVLMVSQDTGGAIIGPVRGDIFFGFGGDAPELAGAMQEPGQMTVFLPTALAAKLEAALSGLHQE